MFEGDPNDLVSQLHNYNCDVIFAHLPEYNPLPANFEHIHYIDDALSCILPLSHPLAGKEELHLEQLRDETFIALAENHTLHQLILNTCHRVGFSPNIAFLCHRVDSVLDLVTKGMGIALIAEYMTIRPEDGNFPERAPFATARLLPRTTFSVDLCYRKNETLSPMAKRFIEFVQEKTDSSAVSDSV